MALVKAWDKLVFYPRNPEPEEAMDDLFREAGIEPNGKVKYDEFIHKITIPVQDY